MSIKLRVLRQLVRFKPLLSGRFVVTKVANYRFFAQMTQFVSLQRLRRTQFHLAVFAWQLEKKDVNIFRPSFCICLLFKSA